MIISDNSPLLTIRAACLTKTGSFIRLVALRVRDRICLKSWIWE